MLISPAEPPEFRRPGLLGTVSSLTERYGADFLLTSPVFGLVGVQRKEIKDLVASIQDGRVEREIWQMKGLSQAIWLIEGRLDWTSDGQLLSSTRSKYTKANHLGVILSLQSRGFWILNSSSVPDSIELLLSLNRWLSKDRHESLSRRPSSSTPFGSDRTDEQIHIMQGFAGVGYKVGKAIVEAYNGLPFQLLEPGEEGGEGMMLEEVKGVGPKLATRIRQTLRRNGDNGTK